MNSSYRAIALPFEDEISLLTQLADAVEQLQYVRVAILLPTF
nr:hypothetical protein [Hassalia byssoidea]